MSKSIKVSEDVYKMLQELQRPRETFSELIERLLVAAVLLSKLEPIIRGQQALSEWKVQQLEKQKAALG